MKYTGNLEFEVESVDERHALARMAIQPGVLNPFGTIHAGAIIWLADVTATVLALGGENVPDGGKGFPLAINLSTNMLANQRGGEITAEACFVRKGSQVIVIRTTVKGDEGRLLAEITSTHVLAR
jgi:uncharacterized protein (TIGR00369 family)